VEVADEVHLIPNNLELSRHFLELELRDLQLIIVYKFMIMFVCRGDFLYSAVIGESVDIANPIKI
jgi:hypothetical protein